MSAINGAHLRLVSAQPAIQTEAQPVTTLDMGEREMRVLIRPLNTECWEYEGTRAQLEAEGVIPVGAKWPEGQDWLRWDDGLFSWSLGRTRPDGMKGPMRLWIRGDWWALRCHALHRPDYYALCILKKKSELAAELYRQSKAGRRECEAAWQRYVNARDDDRFQSFKAKIPGLTPSKRGRKPKGVSSQGGQQ